MSHTARAVRFIGPFVLAGLMTFGACTTEFITEGGNCTVDGDCETGEVCRGVAGAGDAGMAVGVCLRSCRVDSDCVSARDEICRLDPDGVSGVCGRECARDSDCPGEQVCRFDQCVGPLPAPVPDETPDADGADAAPDQSVDQSVDAAPVDQAVDAAPVDQAVDAAPADQAVDAAPADDMAVDALPVGADALPADMAPADPA